MSEIKVIPVSELLGMNFFIPSYQRGYRWDEEQIEELLNDICDFNPKKNDEWYCLQPLVVKNVDKKNKIESVIDELEVIDGQQRITTIFLIIHYFNEMWTEEKDKEPKIRYLTRENSYKFLCDMKVENDDVKIDDSNIDYQHISTAYKAIHEWVKGKGSFDDRKDFRAKFKENTKIIWYKTDTPDGRDIFSRLNMYKIPLTNAELIKALFLNSSNFKTGNKDEEERIRLKQLEIAIEWDNIEAILHNDEFWLFINKTENQIENRIEFLFELLVEKPNGSKGNRFTFRKYCENFIKKDISDNWKIVKRYFQTLYDWFENRELYHKIGFLITTGEEIRDLLKLYLSENKNNFIELINEKMKFSDILIDGLKYKDSDKVREILLLHNILTMLNNKKENSRFPFNRYKRDKWDIEHIHAIATEIPKGQHQKDWLHQAMEFIDKKDEKNVNLIERIDNYSEENFEQLFKDILNYFDEKGMHKDINDLSNLVLLDAETNRSYKNAIFPVKRKIIIAREKEGTFVPICTKNVFMKYYSPQIEQMTFWSEIDKEEYFKSIKEVLIDYLPTQKE